MCVNWDDAKAYVRWLSRKAGQNYRLLSESEWEYMARAGSSSKYPFGNSESALCGHGNGADQTAKAKYSSWNTSNCRDGFVTTVPAGSFRPNNFGIYDVIGNVWEWVEDCWYDSYRGAPIDGSAWTTGGNCNMRVLRGGSWFSGPWYLRSAIRTGNTTGLQNSGLGFRIARTL